MGKDEENLIGEALREMSVFREEMATFRGEMKEFRKNIMGRMEVLENKTLMCQVNPATCATARKLEEHIKSDGSRSGKLTGIIACVVSCMSLLLSLLKNIKVA